SVFTRPSTTRSGAAASPGGVDMLDERSKLTEMKVVTHRVPALLLLVLMGPACGGGGGNGQAPVAPGAFSLIAPAAGATGVAPRTSFSWNASAGAASYLLEVAQDAAFTTIVVQTSVASTGHLLPAPLKGNTVHYWRVTAVNAVGNTLCDAAPRSFTTGPPVPG